jgi:predicted amidohydrolase YtcJ
MARAVGRDPWDARHYVIHGDWIGDDTMKLMSENGIAISTQSECILGLLDDTIARLGPEAAAEQFPLKQLMDSGVLVCNGSDVPSGSTPDWRPGMQAAIVRESLSGVVSGPHQALSVEEAIRSYTINGAFLDHMEEVKGSIEAGKYADFCVLGSDITAIDPHEIVNTPIHMTIVGGHVVYSDGELD